MFVIALLANEIALSVTLAIDVGKGHGSCGHARKYVM